MPFRTMMVEPEAVAALTATFEKAWSMVEARGVIDPLRVAGQRERLAYIIVGLWKDEPDGELAQQAVEQFFAASGTLSVPSDLAQPLDL
jgi:hypothetical protein